VTVSSSQSCLKCGCDIRICTLWN